MADIIARRVCADIEGEFVVFLIGMRINKPWKFWKWLPVARAMPAMLKELEEKPALGLLHAFSAIAPPVLMSVQYWRNFEHLEAYARARDQLHLPAWQAFNRAVASNGDVGIWHETYIVAPGRHETIYNNMPRFGLGAAAEVVDAVGARQEARKRMKAA